MKLSDGGALGGKADLASYRLAWGGRPVRVAILALTGPGGILDYAELLALGLAHYHDVTLITSTKRSIPGVAAWHIPRANWYRRTLVRELERCIEAADPDIVHDAVGSADFKSAFAVSRLWLGPVPLVVSLHDPLPHSGIPYSYRILHAALTRALVSRATAVVTHGSSTLRAAERLFRPRFAGTIPLPVAVPDGSFNSMGDGRTVLFFGSLRWNKGPDRLLKIAATTRSAVPRARFVVAGQIAKGTWTAQRRVLRTLQEMQRDATFEVKVGFVPAHEVQSLFNQASVVLLPYRDATQSGVLSIAAAYGKCVVATAVGDIPDVVTHGRTGLLAHRNSESELADLIVWALTNPTKAAQLGRALQEFARVHMSPGAVAKRLSEMYAACVSPSFGGRGEQ